jgi:GNAT superfamily N-acetyltransferase
LTEAFTLRDAEKHEQRELTRLCVRATLRAGYDEAFIDRVMPSLTITLPLISGGCVQVAERRSGGIAGVVAATTTGLVGIGLLHGLFVDPPFWRHGVGRMLFGAAVARARALELSAIMIYAEPTAEGFYRRLGAIRIGKVPFVLSPDVMLPHLLYVVPRED